MELEAAPDLSRIMDLLRTSGVAQVAEAFWQLTGQAGARQIHDARWALTHVTGGGTAGLDHGACTIHLFEAA